MDAITATILRPFAGYTFDKRIAFAAAFVVFIALRLYRSRRLRTPKLAGPPSKSFLLGARKEMVDAPHLGVLYAEWEKKYGTVYEVSSTLGSKMLILGDPMGIAHFFAKDTTTYNQPNFAKVLSRRLFGEILLIVEGETHKRQRRAMSSGFSVSAIQNVLPVFLDCANKLTATWNTILETESGSQDGSAGFIMTDIQKWMNYVSFDSIGKSAFSHDFGMLTGGQSPVMEAFEGLASIKPSFSLLIFFLLGPVFPRLVMKIPTKRVRTLRMLSESIREIAMEFLSKKPGENVELKSILGALIKSETARSNVQMSLKEIEAQQLLMIAGYQTTAGTLTWAFTELARNLEMQKTLRAELEERIPAGEVASHDKLMNDLPYLDAFICEILRLHPAAIETLRQAVEDDIIPLSRPITTASGTLIDSLPVAKGTIIRIPIIGVNRSEALWGPDAAVFDPTRWLEEKPGKSNKRMEEIHGYRHLLTFGNGPRACLGRVFALTEIKAVLSVLVRNFTFEFPDGPETKIIGHQVLTPGPKVASEEGTKLPFIVRKVSSD